MFCLHFSVMLRHLFDDQNFTVCSINFSMFKKSWKYGKDLFTCFVEFEKVYDHVYNFGWFRKIMALMVGCCMLLSHSMVPTGIAWYVKWQAIKGFQCRL